MKHVRLPIYDGDEELNEHLEVGVALLEYIASISIMWKDHVKVVEGPTPEQEMDFIDRIMCGLPTQEERLGIKPPSAHFRLHQDGRVEKLVQNENLEWGPADLDHNRVALQPQISKKVKPIPGFSQYTMDSLGRIYDQDDKTVSIVKGGRYENAVLTNDDGVMKRMSVDHLFKQTFPEYN